MSSSLSSRLVVNPSSNKAAIHQTLAFYLQNAIGITLENLIFTFQLSRSLINRKPKMIKNI